MNGAAKTPGLALETDFCLGPLRVAPSACRVFLGNEEIRVEAKTMAVLVVLARTVGSTVTRDELISACWQGRVVSDDAITRTLAKVRAIARGIDPAPFTVETLPKIGYRLICPNDGLPSEAAVAPAEPIAFGQGFGSLRRGWQPLAAALIVALAIPVGWATLSRKDALGEPTFDAQLRKLPTAGEVAEALILLDKTRVQRYLELGWDPNWKLDSEGNSALHTLFLACERNPGHDRGTVAVIAQMLVVAGVDPVAKNKWGDSPLDIARSRRYCGPYHPVVDYLSSMSPEHAAR